MVKWDNFWNAIVDYPVQLHDYHIDMPLAPENSVITREMLSDVTVEMGKKFGSKFPPKRKLSPDLMHKTK